jgi:hypothetical protein
MVVGVNIPAYFHTASQLSCNLDVWIPTSETNAMLFLSITARFHTVLQLLCNIETPEYHLMKHMARCCHLQHNCMFQVWHVLRLQSSGMPYSLVDMNQCFRGI